ncbi:tRNA-specific adenosine deaminase [Escovopsis weberi]|uniref:tRNA-specific adenosine deaminase n=1 Tax=Escovopsis weberi TaxID=150374 RepID=A0A0M8MZH4_ESCWE|nr:tRNA-specific adenosine deaminase [Escovopsis weberi]
MVRLTDDEALRLAIALAREALEAGDPPFGAVLVDREGQLLRGERNRAESGEDGDYVPDALLHAEMNLATWATYNLDPRERTGCVLFCSGEPCAMCAVAWAIVGLGGVVFASSTAQYLRWKNEYQGKDCGFVSPLGMQEVAPHIPARGPLAGWD